MSSRIEQLIDEIEEYIDSCKYQAFSNSKILVNKDEIEELIIYSDSELSARYLGEAVQNGKAGFLGEEVIIDIAPYLGSESLKEVLLSMDDISFDLLCDCAPYLGSSKMEEVLRKYLKDGGKLSYSQFDDISPYLSREAIERLDDISFSL